MTYPDFAEALQARICADLEAEKIAHTPRKRREADERRVEILEVHIAALEERVATAEVLGEQRRHEADLGEQQRQEAQTAAERADDLVAELIEITGEFVEMSKRIAEQTAEMDKLRAELNDYRSR